MPWSITSLVISAISGAVRLTGTTNANRLEYLIQAAPGSVPVLATPATGREIVTPGSPFEIDVAVANGDWRVDARAVAVDMAAPGLGIGWMTVGTTLQVGGFSAIGSMVIGTTFEVG